MFVKALTNNRAKYQSKDPVGFTHWDSVYWYYENKDHFASAGPLRTCTATALHCWKLDAEPYEIGVLNRYLRNSLYGHAGVTFWEISLIGEHLIQETSLIHCGSYRRMKKVGAKGLRLVRCLDSYRNRGHLDLTNVC